MIFMRGVLCFMKNKTHGTCRVKLFVLLSGVFMLLLLSGCAKMGTEIKLDGSNFSGSRVMSVTFDVDEDACDITVYCKAVTDGKTGVEMEALTGVSVTLLTIYDMCKAIDKRMLISDIHLTEKTGGKSGDFRYIPPANDRASGI